MTTRADDEYWLQRGRAFIDESEPAILKAGESLLTLITWAFPVYTASAVFSIEHNEIGSWWAVFFALPYAFLFWSYWAAIRIGHPKTSNIDPRVPHLVRLSYRKSIETKSKRLKQAQELCGISMTVLVLVLMSSFVVKNTMDANPETIFETSLSKEDNGALATVKLRLPNARTADIFITGVDLSKGQADTLRYRHSRFLTSDFELNTSFEVSPNPVQYSVRVSWKNGTLKQSLERDVLF